MHIHVDKIVAVISKWNEPLQQRTPTPFGFRRRPRTERKPLFTPATGPVRVTPDVDMTDSWSHPPRAIQALTPDVAIRVYEYERSARHQAVRRANLKRQGFLAGSRFGVWSSISTVCAYRMFVVVVQCVTYSWCLSLVVPMTCGCTCDRKAGGVVVHLLCLRITVFFAIAPWCAVLLPTWDSLLQPQRCMHINFQRSAIATITQLAYEPAWKRWP